jgi:hypothetical protein
MSKNHYIHIQICNTIVIIFIVGAQHLRGDITTTSFPPSLTVTFVSTVSIATAGTMVTALIRTSICKQKFYFQFISRAGGIYTVPLAPNRKISHLHSGTLKGP